MIWEILIPASINWSGPVWVCLSSLKDIGWLFCHWPGNRFRYSMTFNPDLDDLNISPALCFTISLWDACCSNKPPWKLDDTSYVVATFNIFKPCLTYCRCFPADCWGLLSSEYLDRLWNSTCGFGGPSSNNRYLLHTREGYAAELLRICSWHKFLRGPVAAGVYLRVTKLTMLFLVFGHLVRYPAGIADAYVGEGHIQTTASSTRTETSGTQRWSG